MDGVDSIGHGTAISYGCSSCDRCFVALGEAKADEVFCPCGGKLTPQPFVLGLYELKSAVGLDTRPTNPGRPPMPAEPDVGYGASHGYDATHGGPSGPGDAPAEVSEPVTARPGRGPELHAAQRS